MTLKKFLNNVRGDIAIDRSMNRRSRSWRDFIRPFLVPQLTCLLIYRVSRLLYLNRMKPIAKILRSVNVIIFGFDIHPDADIAGGCFIGHTNGIVIGPHVRVGRDCIIFHGVTLTAASRPGVELSNVELLRVGDRVCIYSGAAVIGSLTIESDVCIGANAVVVKSVMHGMTVVGIPARPISKEFE